MLSPSSLGTSPYLISSKNATETPGRQFNSNNPSLVKDKIKKTKFKNSFQLHGLVTSPKNFHFQTEPVSPD